ncbi:hypothetical protein [Shewanella maritima]|uniref:hypothetical protein n=1 Tax=Shewanella maritima TaxID=2520507 RepID=UPI003735B77D
MNLNFTEPPQLVSISLPASLHIVLPDDVSELALLANAANPMIEIIVQHMDSNNVQLVVKHLPFVHISINHLDVKAATIKDKENTDLSGLTQSTKQLSRGLGQGFRCYGTLGIEPKRVSNSLRQGVDLCLSLIDNQLQVEIDTIMSIDLIGLEFDLRSPIQIQCHTNAAAILARQTQFNAPSNELTLEISEIDLVRKEITLYLRGELGVVDQKLITELSRLDALLESKRQWLWRSYQESQSRPSLNEAANTQDIYEIAALQRRLDCFELLAPKSLVDVVDKLADDH